MTGLSTCIFTQWTPGIGDPNLVGWLTVALYLIAAGLACTVATQLQPQGIERRERLFWFFAAGLLLALGVNKQLDLQSLLTATGRCLAQAQGWYDARHDVQRTFILGLIALCALVILFAARTLRGTLRRTALPLIALIFVLGFVTIRAAGFHDMDALISHLVGPFRVNWLLEIPCPTLIILCALHRICGRMVD